MYFDRLRLLIFGLCEPATSGRVKLILNVVIASFTFIKQEFRRLNFASLVTIGRSCKNIAISNVITLMSSAPSWSFCQHL